VELLEMITDHVCSTSTEVERLSRTARESGDYGRYAECFLKALQSPDWMESFPEVLEKRKIGVAD
jgi:hypothetical protein